MTAKKKRERERERERELEPIGCLVQTIQAISLPICISQRVHNLLLLGGGRYKFLLISYYPFLCKCSFDLFVIPI